MIKGCIRSFTLMLALLLWHCNAFALKPAKEYDLNPDTLHAHLEKNTITTSDNFHLKSWTFLPAKKKNNKMTLVVAYADAGNMSWYVTQAQSMAQAGYTVVLFDYRGFGASDNFSINPDMLYYNEFTTDLIAVFKFAKERYKENKTGFWSFSMGTIVATLASTTVSPDFMIADSWVTDLVKLKKYYETQKIKIILPQQTTDYLKAVRSVKMPTLAFAGKSDPVAPYSSILAVSKKNPLVTIYQFDGGHMEAFGRMSKDYPGSDYVKVMGTYFKLK